MNVKVKDESVNFFGNVDKGSEYPSWYNKEHSEELKRTVDQTRNQLERGTGISSQRRGELREKLNTYEKRLDAIKESTPKLSAPQSDRLNSARKELGEKIAASKFSYSDMQRGTADAHEEARRLSEPIIKVDPELAKACGVTTTKGQVNRTQAERIWKIVSKGLGENSNTEVLRRD